MRPIDAEKLINRAVMVEALDGNGCPYEFLAVPLITVKNSPTIEAKPVVHAHWEDGKCSNCKEEASSRSWDEPIYDYDWDENLQYLYTEHHREYELTDFCPHCGARMDEEVERNENE